MFSLDVLNIVLRRTEESLDWTKVPKGRTYVSETEQKNRRTGQRSHRTWKRGTKGQDISINVQDRGIIGQGGDCRTEAQRKDKVLQDRIEVS